MAAKERKRGFLPPTYLVFFLVLAIGLHFVLPIVHIVPLPYNLGGLLLIGIGIWLNMSADGLFKTNKTTVKPFEKSSALILEGPFRFTRHPMYLGMGAALVGEAIILGSLIAFAAPIAFIVSMELTFIPYEEKALEGAFGEDYSSYKRRVRRWV